MRFPHRSGRKPLMRGDGAPSFVEGRQFKHRTAFHSRECRVGRPALFHQPNPIMPPRTKEILKSDEIMLEVMKLALQGDPVNILDIFRRGIECGKVLAAEAKEGE